MENDVFDKIEAFINEEMNSEEKLLFEKEMSANQQLANRVQLYRELEQTLKLSESGKENENRLQQTLSAVQAEYMSSPGKVIRLRKINKWYAAAAAVFVIGLTVFLFQKNSRHSIEEVYAQYAVFPLLSNTRGTSDTMLSKATRYYNSKQFAEAAPLLKQSLAVDSSDMEIKLAFYICALQTGNFSEALKGFTNIAATENVFVYQARWYMALTFLKQHDIAACKKILTDIPPSADTFSNAQQLLKQLSTIEK